MTNANTLADRVGWIRKRAGKLLRMENVSDKTAGAELLIVASIIERDGPDPSARITGDKDRGNPVEGAPYGEGLIGRIDALSSECQRLHSALQYIADLAYVDHQGGNQNFEYLQTIARDALRARNGSNTDG